MNFPAIDEMRVLVGLQDTDASRDAEIIALGQLSLELVERVCNRKFPYNSEIETFTHFEGYTLTLERYPVNTIIKIDADGTEPKYHLDEVTGLIHFDQYVKAHRIEVSYAGGYNDPDWPAALISAIKQTLVAYWAVQGASGLGAGVVQSVTSEGQTVRFFKPEDGADVGGFDTDTGLPVNALALLRTWRREYA